MDLNPTFPTATHLDDPAPHSAAWNMAFDEALFRLATGPLIRTYRWLKPAVSFGYFTRFADVQRFTGTHEAIRRWTGGGVVFHCDDLTYTIVVPRSCEFAALPIAETYLRIHRAIARSIPGAVLAASQQTSGSSECFAAPVLHDVLLEGMKIAGAAQRRSRHGLLHQGSIQAVRDPLAFKTRFVASLCGKLDVRAPTAEEVAEAERLVSIRYGQPAWNRRI